MIGLIKVVADQKDGYWDSVVYNCCDIMGEEAWMKYQLTFELPDDVFSALRKKPEDFLKELRLAAAVKWYEMGVISQEKAAEIAGVSRQAFIESLAKFNVSPFQYDEEELEEELADERDQGI